MSRLLNIEDVKSIWASLEQQDPELITQITSKFKNEVLRHHYEQMQLEALQPQNKPDSNALLQEPEPPKLNQKNIKDAKPIDGLEVEWKNGKLKPADQTTYRSPYNE